MNMDMRVRSVLIWACIAAVAECVCAQIVQKSSVADASGTRATGGTFTHLSAGGQPGGIAVSSAGNWLNQAGFLNTFFLRRDLDTDSDGLPNEADLDNDGDTLLDIEELTGVAFLPMTPTDPNMADTDGDDSPDSDEAEAGTDPTDANASLRVIAFERTNFVQRISWLARGNNERGYLLYRSPGLNPWEDELAASNRVAGGTPPWYVVTNTIFDGTTSTAAFYRVEVKP